MTTFYYAFRIFNLLGFIPAAWLRVNFVLDVGYPVLARAVTGEPHKFRDSDNLVDMYKRLETFYDERLQ